MGGLAARVARGVRRLLGRTPTRGIRRFEAARIDRLTADWFATSNSINAELQGDLDRLRARARQLANNNDYARKFVGMVQNNIIGPDGIRLQSRVEDAPGRADELASAAVERAWADWSAACDITGQCSLRDLCDTVAGALPTDGEFLVRMVRGPEAGNRFNFALQVIDVDRIDTTYSTTLPGGRSVVMGVEVDLYRRPLALHLFTAHPNDAHGATRQRVRVPVGDVLHRFRVERAEQARGIPWMAPGMLSLHHLGGFMLSALLAAEHGANHYGFFVSPDGRPPAIGQDDGTGQQITASQPGVYDTLPTGVDFRPHESKYPNDVFGPFAKTCLQRIATGWRVAYHSLANDLEGVSFSSIRSGTLEERDRWAADQAWFVGAFMEPVFQAWLQMALLSGAITMPNGNALPASKLHKFAAHEWQPRRWEWVDPRADMEAKVLAVRAGLLDPQSVAAAMGNDFADVVARIAAANKMAAAHGVDLNAYAPTHPSAQPTAPGAGT